MAAILIADDVAMARDQLARALRERGHRVQVVVDGQDALDRFTRERPDLVILDVMMPRLSGLEACSRMKALGGSFVPAIIMSARTDLENRLAALAVAEDFVPKPYDIAEMCARVEAHLRTRRLIDEASGLPQVAPVTPSRPNSAGEADSAVPQPMSESKTGRHGKSGGLSPKLFDRAGLLERMGEEWKRSARSNEPMTLLLCGLDSLPPSTGEHPVSLIVAAMQRALRSIDVLARVDDQVVAGLLLNTHVTGAMTAADRLRKELRKVSVDGSTPVVSMGMSFHPMREVVEPSDLLRLAERAIARAREEGPGRICLWQHQGYLFDPPE